jgi:hypothetical protein
MWACHTNSFTVNRSNELISVSSNTHRHSGSGRLCGPTYNITPVHAPHSTSRRFNLILSSHLSLDAPSGLFPSGFPHQNLYATFFSPNVLHALPISIFSIWSPERYWVYRSVSNSLCGFIHYPFTSSLLGPNILLSTLFSNTISLRSSLNESDPFSHPYKTTGKIWVLCTLIFKFLDNKLEDKRFCTEW